MPDLLVDAEAQRTSPLISIWLNPRQTIERIVAGRPRYLVLPLVTLGGASSAANMLTGYGAGSEIVGWRTFWDLRSFCRLPPVGASSRLARSHGRCRPCSIS